MQTLIAEDSARVTPDDRDEVSSGLRSLLHPLPQHEKLIDIACPCLSRLAAETGLASKLSMRQSEQAIALARTESPQGTALSVRTGSTFSLSLGSSGAVLLSELPVAEKHRLLSLALQECWELTFADGEKLLADCGRSGVYALSSTVRSREGIIVEALTVIGFGHDFEDRNQKTNPLILLAIAAACSQALEGTSQPVAA